LSTPDAVLPLLFPVDSAAGAGVREYWALDKDPRAITATREYARVPRGPAHPAGPVEHRDGWQAAFAVGPAGPL